MADLRHPHIVQFLGLCFLEGSALPVLVMEKLDSSLDDLLEGAPGLPLSLKRTLLADVARGLLYLHTRNPHVVHRDLSARNVLLTSSLVAKISDLGNARIVNLQPGQLVRTLTRIPGTMVYMPPEAFDDPPRYGPRLDIFSFGHLALFTLTQVRKVQTFIPYYHLSNYCLIRNFATKHFLLHNRLPCIVGEHVKLPISFTILSKLCQV